MGHQSSGNGLGKLCYGLGSPGGLWMGEQEGMDISQCADVFQVDCSFTEMSQRANSSSNTWVFSFYQIVV